VRDVFKITYKGRLQAPMVIQALVFYLFASVAIVAGALVVSVRNPVHSVLFLILTFFNAAGLFILMGAEFLAMILVVVYVGAVAVLFLFVVMMLDFNVVDFKRGLRRYLPIGGLVGAILLGELLFVVIGWSLDPGAVERGAAPTAALAQLTNTEALGHLIYTQYLYAFQASGIILLVAMIGAIVLTHRRRPGVRRQDIATQLARTPANTVNLRKVPTGKGI
jgi:NADH-quinone oxidoreductase subunit J